MRRIAGLDSIRFFCALTVVFFHQISPPIFSFLSGDTPVGKTILGLYDAAFNGPAAVLAISHAAAAGAILYTLNTREWPGSFLAGNLTWLAGMPCWILGCHLAERFATVKVLPPVSAPTLWGYRVGAGALGFACYFAMLHFHVSFLWSLHLFALFAYLWIQAELKWYLDQPPNRWFERLGSLTFSIYLMHALARCIWDGVNTSRGLLWWFLEAGFVLCLSAVFYFLVERPSHLLARFLSRGPGALGKSILQRPLSIS